MTHNNTPIQPQNAFSDEVALMYAPFRDYVPHVVALMLEHIWGLASKGRATLTDLLIGNGWLGRLITLDKRVLDPIRQEEIRDWPQIRKHLLRSLGDCKSQAQLPEAVHECMRAVMHILEKRFQDDYRFPNTKFNSWWFTIHDNDTHLALHLINGYQPDSPFDHLNHFTATMLEAVEQGLSLYPGLRIVSCGSWLNQFPGFQQLWPESFRQGQRILNETGGFGPGAWGQYMTAAGGFNEVNAGILRKAMRHPFALTEASCPLEELRMHLKKCSHGAEL